MSIIKRRRLELKVTPDEKLEEYFFKQIEMSKDRAMKKFADNINESKERILSSIRIEAIFESYPVESRDAGKIILECTTFGSEMLVKVLETSDEVLLYVVIAFGYDAIEKEEDDMMKLLFLDSWGTVAIGAADSMLEEILKEELAEQDLYTTHSWSPGQHEVDISLQAPLFGLLKPEETGVKLNQSYMMYPKKSISGIIGIGRDKDVSQIRACDYCKLRETCPSAYS